MSRVTALTASTVAGYAEGAMSAPARSAMPRAPRATTITVTEYRNRIGPRLRGLTGLGCSGTAYDGWAYGWACGWAYDGAVEVPSPVSVASGTAGRARRLG